MISIYFGFPRSGKTTYMAKLAFDLIKKGKKVFGNVPLKIPGYIFVNTDCFYTYDITDAECLIDEGTVFFDSRDFADKDKRLLNRKVVNWVCLHGHDRVNIHFFTQIWNRLDKTIRDCSERVYWIYKPFFFGLWFSKVVKVPYSLAFSTSVDDRGKAVPGEIAMGYVRPSFFDKLLSPLLFRPKYYKFFDSWSRSPRPKLPPVYTPYVSPPAAVTRH